MSKDKHFVPNVVIYWPADVASKIHTVGFIPVYADLETLRAHHPDAEYRQENVTPERAQPNDLKNIVPL